MLNSYMEYIRWLTVNALPASVLTVKRLCVIRSEQGRRQV